jgi:hypothetical protein
MAQASVQISGRLCAKGTSTAATLAHTELFFAVKPEQTLMINIYAFAPQKDFDTAIPKPAPLMRNRFLPVPQMPPTVWANEYLIVVRQHCKSWHARLWLIL